MAYATGLRLKATGTELFRFSNSPITRAGRLKRGRTASSLQGYEYGDYKAHHGRERIVLPVWLYPVIAILILGLSYSVWRVWSPEILARLIPEAEIQKIAEDLITQHGVKGAKAVVLTMCQAAIQRNDLFEMAKWDRVISSLNEALNTKQ